MQEFGDRYTNYIKYKATNVCCKKIDNGFRSYVYRNYFTNFGNTVRSNYLELVLYQVHEDLNYA
jgi:predicted alpha/beta-fold hydrolase